MTRFFSDDAPMLTLATAALFVEIFLFPDFLLFPYFSPWLYLVRILCFFCCLFPHLFI